MDDPRPSWYVFNRISTLPVAGLAVIAFALAENRPVYIALGVPVAALGTWLTMRRLSGRVSERSLAWVGVDTAVLFVGVAIVIAFNLSGWKMAVAVVPFAFVSESVATALTGVREVE